MTLEEALWQDPARVSGAVCFRGTRIPVAVLFDYLDAKDPVGFFEDFPDVTPEMVEAVLREARVHVEATFKKKNVA